MKEFPSESFNNEVKYHVDNGIAVITLNAPQRMNTMSAMMNLGVLTALEIAADDDDVKVVVFTGAGKKAFCAGGNLAPDDSGKPGASAGFRQKDGKVPPTAYGAIRNLRTSMNSSLLLRNIPKVTIAAVNGACAGAGFSWACACDIRFASENAIFRSAFLTAGLSGDFGGTWTLPRIVGTAKAKELYLLNKKISAQEAKTIGLCSEIYPQEKLMEEAMAAAQAIAKSPQLALKRIKINLNEADEITSFSQALDNEAERHARTGMHPDAAEAGAAFMKKREPKFTGLGKVEKWRYSKI